MSFQYTFIVFIGSLHLGLMVPCQSGFFNNTNGSCTVHAQGADDLRECWTCKSLSDPVTCTVCPPGTFGINCSGLCQNGTYGLKCAYNCTCEDCDPAAGCPSTTIEVSETTISVDITTVPHPDTDERLVFYIVSSTLGFLLIFTLICCLSKRKKERPTQPVTNAENVSTGRSDNPEYTTLQFAGLRRYDGANIASTSIYGVGQLGRDMPENGEYDMGLTLPTVDEMRQKVIEGETNSPSGMDIYSKDEDNPYMNFRRSEVSPCDLADVSYAV